MQLPRSSREKQTPRAPTPRHPPNPPGGSRRSLPGAWGLQRGRGSRQSPRCPPRRRPASGGVPGGRSRPGSGGAGAAPGATPAPGPPPARRSIPGWAGRADSRARRPPRAHPPGSARRRRSCPAPTCGGGCPGPGELPPPAPLALPLPALQDEPGVFPALLAAHHPRHLLGQRQQLAVSSRGARGEEPAPTLVDRPGGAGAGAAGVRQLRGATPGNDAARYSAGHWAPVAVTPDTPIPLTPQTSGSGGGSLHLGQGGCGGCQPFPAAQVRCVIEVGWTEAGYRAHVPILSLSYKSRPQRERTEVGASGQSRARGLARCRARASGPGEDLAGLGRLSVPAPGICGEQGCPHLGPLFPAGQWVAGGCCMLQRSLVTLGTW